MSARKSTREYPDYHNKPLTGFRLSEESLALIEALREFYGVGKADVVEMALRTLARQATKSEGFQPPRA